MMVGPSSSVTWGVEPSSKRALPLDFLVGVLPVCVWHWLLVYATSASPISALTVKSGAEVTGVMPRLFRSPVGVRRAR
jgi:hypothetical protein